MSKIKIVYWSDFVCPFCYIGEERMKNVMKELNIFDKFEFKFLSFELDPDAPKNRNLTIAELLAKKYRMPIEHAKENVAYIDQLGKKEGLDFKFSSCKDGNTFNAHRLVKYVESKGNYENTEKLITLLYDAYFTKNQLISDDEVLIKLGMENGLTKDEIEKLFKSDNFTKEVRDDEQKGYIEGVHGVPYFIINGTEVINGAVSKEEMKKTLLKVLNGKNGPNKGNHQEGITCDENGCYIKK